MTMWLPNVREVLFFHERLIARTGGLHGVRDEALIEMALARAYAAFGGVQAHAGIIDKAAAVCCGLTQNHGFIDGNKRIGILTMLMILRRNGVAIRYAQDELIALGLGIACSRLDVREVAQWIGAHRA